MSYYSFGALYRLARLYGVQTAFYNLNKRRQAAPPEAVLAVLPALGAPVATLDDVEAALRARRQELKRRVVAPVTLAYEDERPVIDITLPEKAAIAPGAALLTLESGDSIQLQLSTAREITAEEVENTRYLTRRFTLPRKLPAGYHKFSLDIKGKIAETLIISSPRRAFSPPGRERAWGTFLPLYALKTAHDRGAGDYSALGTLLEWVKGEGGKVVGTLPLLPSFESAASPYEPVSRLLWNEFYIDVEKIPELANCPAARDLMQSATFKKELENLKSLKLVDYHGVMGLKRRVMEQLCRCLLDSDSARLDTFRRFIRENPLVEDYARFRAMTEKQGAWRGWKKQEYDEIAKDYYLYAQWQAQQQVVALSEKAHRDGMTLYFDLPVGVHPDGYDAWRFKDIFAGDVRAGAPPDPVFTSGQDWGFPPLHPEKLRASGYRYVIDYLRHHMKHAGMLRIDHVMGLHRLWWIPRGFSPAQGVYVRYPADELYAIIALESQRNRCVVVGEDLGIVPNYIRPAMARHGLQRLYIMYYDLDKAYRPRPVPRQSVASLNTHDMPPFASFWEGTDIKEKPALGLLKKSEVRAEEKARQAMRKGVTGFLRQKGFLRDESAPAVYKACLAFLAASPARTVLVNLEDLWQETEAQNFPGTGDKFPSFRRRARFALEEFRRMREVSDILKNIRTMRLNTLSFHNKKGENKK